MVCWIKQCVLQHLLANIGGLREPEHIIYIALNHTEIRQCVMHFACCCGFSSFSCGGCPLSRHTCASTMLEECGHIHPNHLRNALWEFGWAGIVTSLAVFNSVFRGHQRHWPRIFNWSQDNHDRASSVNLISHLKWRNSSGLALCVWPAFRICWSMLCDWWRVKFTQVSDEPWRHPEKSVNTFWLCCWASAGELWPPDRAAQQVINDDVGLRRFAFW